MSEKRITNEMVLSAYPKIGMIAKRKTTCRNGFCCGLAAVAAVTLHPEPVEFQNIFEASDVLKGEGFSKEYLSGFVSGWDGNPKGPDRSEDNAEGYDDGKSAWKAVVKSGLNKKQKESSE